MKTADINALEMVRVIRDQFYEDTRDLTSAELMAFIARSAAEATQPVDVVPLCSVATHPGILPSTSTDAERGPDR